ncbi:MAG: DUF5132 domain-containing protein [Synechococcales bacterium]|nr:DUF5132 domain-containing protein [Synechococcales bacterium]
MATETGFDFGDINLSEVMEGLGSVLVAPLVLPAAAAVNQPLVKSAIREAIAFSERCKEAVAEASERIEDVVVEAQYEVERRQAEGESYQPEALPPSQPRPIRRAHFAEGHSQTAGEMMSTFDEVNAQVGWLSNGMVDLRTLLPLGIGAFAARQLLIQGLKLDEIPWYTMVWYAFDTFSKLNSSDRSQSPQPSMANGNGNHGFTPSGADTGIAVDEA